MLEPTLKPCKGGQTIAPGKDASIQAPFFKRPPPGVTSPRILFPSPPPRRRGGRGTLSGQPLLQPASSPPRCRDRARSRRGVCRRAFRSHISSFLPSPPGTALGYSLFAIGPSRIRSRARPRHRHPASSIQYPVSSIPFPSLHKSINPPIPLSSVVLLTKEDQPSFLPAPIRSVLLVRLVLPVRLPSSSRCRLKLQAPDDSQRLSGQ